MCLKNGWWRCSRQGTLKRIINYIKIIIKKTPCAPCFFLHYLADFSTNEPLKNASLQWRLQSLKKMIVVVPKGLLGKLPKYKLPKILQKPCKNPRRRLEKSLKEVSSKTLSIPFKVQVSGEYKGQTRGVCWVVYSLLSQIPQKPQDYMALTLNYMGKGKFHIGSFGKYTRVNMGLFHCTKEYSKFPESYTAWNTWSYGTQCGGP